MGKAYNPKKEDYSLNLAEMSVDKRLSNNSKRPYITSCQCKDYPCRECRNRINRSLDELSESEVENIFSQLLVA